MDHPLEMPKNVMEHFTERFQFLSCYVYDLAKMETPIPLITIYNQRSKILAFKQPSV